MPIGLLTDIAMDFGISEARAGLLISIYAWVVMAMSLPLMILCSRIPLRPLLLGVIALFAVSQVFSSISTGYYTSSPPVSASLLPTPSSGPSRPPSRHASSPPPTSPLPWAWSSLGHPSP